MADKQKLEKAVSDFEFWAKVGRSDYETCTVAELNNVVKRLATLVRIIVSELPDN